jgi:hypothetical protein
MREFLRGSRRRVCKGVTLVILSVLSGVAIVVTRAWVVSKVMLVLSLNSVVLHVVAEGAMLVVVGTWTIIVLRHS